MPLLFFFTYVSVIIFIIMILSRGIRLAKSPVHLRWELYPLPHEKGKASYGGSRLEDFEWWNHPQKKDYLSEFFEILTEIALLKGVWKHNRRLWYGSYPFHLGLYIYILNTFIIIFCTFFSFFGVSPVFYSETLIFLSPIVIFLGWFLSLIGISGSVILLYKRLYDRNLSSFSAPSHYFNIVLISALYASSLAWLINDVNFFPHLINYFQNLFSFKDLPGFPISGVIHISISLFLILYIPFTHMTHFFTKYFTYHRVRWEDKPYVQGSKMAKRIAEQLNQPVSWAAPHIGADGSKTWLAIASSSPVKEQK